MWRQLILFYCIFQSSGLEPMEQSLLHTSGPISSELTLNYIYWRAEMVIRKLTAAVRHQRCKKGETTEDRYKNEIAALNKLDEMLEEKVVPHKYVAPSDFKDIDDYMAGIERRVFKMRGQHLDGYIKLYPESLCVSAGKHAYATNSQVMDSMSDALTPFKTVCIKDSQESNNALTVEEPSEPYKDEQEYTHPNFFLYPHLAWLRRSFGCTIVMLCAYYLLAKMKKNGIEQRNEGHKEELRLEEIEKQMEKKQELYEAIA